MSQTNLRPTTDGGISPAVSWQLQLIAGIITLVLGIILSVHPTGTLNVVCVFIGIMIIISGLFHFIRALDRDEPHRIWLTCVGILEVVIGVVLIRHLHFSQALLGLLIGIVWIVQGIVALLSGFIGSPGRSRVWPIIFGLISLAAGVIVVSLPNQSIKTLAIILGIIFLVMGILEIMAAFFLRSDLKKIS